MKFNSTGYLLVLTIAVLGIMHTMSDEVLCQEKICPRYLPCYNAMTKSCNAPDHNMHDGEGLPFCSIESNVGRCQNKQWCYDDNTECPCHYHRPCKHHEKKYCVPFKAGQKVCPDKDLKCPGVKWDECSGYDSDCKDDLRCIGEGYLQCQ